MVNPEEADALKQTVDSLPDDATLSRTIVQAAINAQLPQGGFAFSPEILTGIVSAIVGLEVSVNQLIAAQTPPTTQTPPAT